MTSKKKEILTTALLLFFGVAWVGFGFWRKSQLEKFYKVTIAKTVGVSGGGKGNAGRLFLKYLIQVDGKQYKDSKAFLTSEVSWEDCEKHLTGKTFPAVYNPDYPSISFMLITPKDFARFRQAFPDSLKWVVKYVK